MTNDINLQKIPFPDQRYIDKIRDALWEGSGLRLGGGRASVMVGSGFSKNASPARPSVSQAPAWQEITEKIASKLGLLHTKTRNGRELNPLGSEDFLHLAQDYEDEFGRSELDLLLQRAVRDDDHIPGEFHRRLLKLPWRDVFTTNWDTLLERTRENVPERTYSIVHRNEDIPLMSQPRIFKLHGSFGGGKPPIATARDYDNYRTDSAPLVNTVQQSMMETVLCVIGFSGDDPNFKLWSSWVRKNLKESAPKIFLAGWFGFSDEERAKHEERGVVVIDLERHPRAHMWPEHLRHRYSTEWILHSLEHGEPYTVSDWPSPNPPIYSEVRPILEPVARITSDTPKSYVQPDHSLMTEPHNHLDAVRDLIKNWSYNRKLYPGWLMVPVESRSITFSSVKNWETIILGVLNELQLPVQLQAVRELMWLHEITLQEVSPMLESAAERILGEIDCQARKVGGATEEDIDWPAVREAWRNIALMLITAARYRLDGETFEHRINALKPFNDDSPDVAHYIHYERCLWAIWMFKYNDLADLIRDWDARNCDPIWMIRKSSILSEVGLDEEAHQLNRRALDAIHHFRDDGRDVVKQTRESWALWSVSTFEAEPSKDVETLWEEQRRVREISFKRWSELAQVKCDAFAEKTQIVNGLAPGGNADRSPHIQLAAEAYRAVRLSEVAGLPPFVRYIFPGKVVAADMLKLAGDSLALGRPELALRLVLRSCTSNRDEVFDRILAPSRVASIEYPVVERLVADCHRLIEDGLTQNRIDRASVAMEVLSRLCPRLRDGAALDNFDRALNYYSRRQLFERAHDFADPLRNLLKNAWTALPPSERSGRALDAMLTPIAGIDNFNTQMDIYPDPGDLLLQDTRLQMPDRSESEEEWSSVTRSLTLALRDNRASRRRAASRLVPLALQGLMNEDEIKEVGEALWHTDYTPSDGLPTDTDLHDWVFLILPEPRAGLAKQRFRKKWFSNNPEDVQVGIPRTGNMIQIDLYNTHRDPWRLEDIIWNAGAAMSGLQDRPGSFDLTDEDHRHLVRLIEIWANSEDLTHGLYPIQSEAQRRSASVIQGLEYILSHVAIHVCTAKRICDKMETLAENGIPAYDIVGALIRIVPDYTDRIVSSLRIGLASDNQVLVTSAARGLASWMNGMKNVHSATVLPPIDLVREIGLIIAVRRKGALQSGLEAAKSVFESNDPRHIESICDYTVKGLAYLTTELQYGNEYEESFGDVPLLRRRCSELASAMANAGFGDHDAVRHWLELATNDPMPDVRFAISQQND